MNLRRTLSLVGLCIGAQGCFSDPLESLTAATSDATAAPASTSSASTSSTGPTTDPTTGAGTTAAGPTSGPGACGDGLLDPGEQCDDGDLNGPGRPCKADCTANVCGDGDQGPGEACDDGNIVDDDGCTATCQLTVCGDGIAQGSEECDDGNQVDEDACTNACTAAACGDGIVHAMEQCDDGNMIDDDACTNTCQLVTKRVFVTSLEYSGNLGGVVGADDKCQTHAQKAGLPGTYRAWITDGTDDTAPAVRFVRAKVPYVLTTGTKIADAWDDLTDGTLDAPLNIDENGAMIQEDTDVLTNTLPDGTRKPGTYHCGNWAFNQGASAAVGDCNTLTAGWTDSSLAACSGTNHLYCVEQ